MYEPEEMNPPHPFLKEFPDAYDVYLLDENGNPTQRVNLNRLENSQFWESKYRIIGVVLLLCFGYFVMTLLGESKIMEGAWQVCLSFLGQFMPQLPKLW